MFKNLKITHKHMTVAHITVITSYIALDVYLALSGNPSVALHAVAGTLGYATWALCGISLLHIIYTAYRIHKLRKGMPSDSAGVLRLIVEDLGDRELTVMVQRVLNAPQLVVNGVALAMEMTMAFKYSRFGPCEVTLPTQEYLDIIEEELQQRKTRARVDKINTLLEMTR